DAKAPIFVGNVRVPRRIGQEPGIAAALDRRRVGDVAPDLEDAIGIRFNEIVDLAVEAAVRCTFALPEYGADVFTQQRIRETVEALAVDREPAVRRLAIGNRHRPARGAEAAPVDRHAIDVPGFGD